MYALTAYEQTTEHDPTNPFQRVREVYAGGAGRWASYYWNKLPNAGGSQLKGLGFMSGLPGWAQTGLVLGVSALVGFFGWKKVGDKHVRPVLKKIPVVGGLMGARRKR